MEEGMCVRKALNLGEGVILLTMNSPPALVKYVAAAMKARVSRTIRFWLSDISVCSGYPSCKSAENNIPFAWNENKGKAGSHCRQEPDWNL